MPKYKVIYADPPWHYNGHVAKTKTGDSRVQTQYPTMSDEEILNFPIDTYANTDCVLFLWTTVPNLPLGLQVLKKWGFNYKTCLIWKKDNIKLSHSIKLINGKRIAVCNGHFCDIFGLSEYEYLKRLKVQRCERHGLQEPCAMCENET